MAFGVRDTGVQAGYVPRVEQGNMPVSSPGNSDYGLGGLARGLASNAAKGAAVQRDMAFGQDLGDALEVITQSKLTNSPVETARRITEITSLIAKRHGADAATQANTLLNNSMKAAGSTKLLDAKSNLFADVDEKGNVLRQWTLGGDTEHMEQPQTSGDIIREDQMKRTAYLANAAPQFSSSVNEIMGVVGPALQQQPEGTFHVQRAVGESYTALRKIEGWQQRIAQATVSVPNVEALAEYKAQAAKDIRGSGISALQSLVNKSFLDATRGTESMDPAFMARMSQGFVTDWFNNMDELGMFAALDLDPAEERAKMQAVADKVSELFKADYEGDLTRINRVEAETGAILGTLENQAVLNMPKEKRDQYLLSQKMLAVAQANQVIDTLNNQNQALGGPRDRWETIRQTAQNPNPTNNLRKMWDREKDSKLPYSSPNAMISFLEGLNEYVEGSQGALWGDISKYITENKAQLIKKAQEFGLDITTYFDNQPDLDKAFEEAVKANGMTVEEFSAAIVQSEEVARELQYYRVRRNQ